MRAQSKVGSGESVVRLPCACANLRRAARAATQLYEQMLRPTGLSVMQFTLLQALVQAPGMSQKQMAELLAIDSTTLTRTLGLPRRNGWVRFARGPDRRELRLSLTAAGQREYRRVLPFWKSAQKTLKLALGEAHWNQAIGSAVRIVDVVRRLKSR